IDVPIEQIQRLNGQVVSAMATAFEYNSQSGLIYPKDIFKYEPSSSNSSFSESTNGSVFSDYTKRATYHAYDDKGNLLEFSREDDLHISYIWGYNDQYPIAKIENLSYSSIPLSTINNL